MDIISQIPTVKVYGIESQNTLKFYDNPMVNEFGIVVLRGRFWVSVGKEKATMRSVFLLALTCFHNSQR